MSQENLQLLCIDLIAAWICRWAWRTVRRYMVCECVCVCVWVHIDLYCSICSSLQRSFFQLHLVSSHYWLPWDIQPAPLSLECAEPAEMMWTARICMRNAWIYIPVYILGGGGGGGGQVGHIKAFRCFFIAASTGLNWLIWLKLLSHFISFFYFLCF